MLNASFTKESLTKSLASDLARLLSCGVDELPTAVSLDVAGEFLGIANRATFHVWKSSRRHPLVWMKRGKNLEIGTTSLIALRVSQADIPQQAA